MQSPHVSIKLVASSLSHARANVCLRPKRFPRAGIASLIIATVDASVDSEVFAYNYDIKSVITQCRNTGDHMVDLRNM